MKNNIINFPTTHKAKLIQSLKEIGYSPEQIEAALLFVENNPPDNDPPPRPRKKVPRPEGKVIDFPKPARVIQIIKNAA